MSGWMKEIKNTRLQEALGALFSSHTLASLTAAPFACPFGHRRMSTSLYRLC